MLNPGVTMGELTAGQSYDGVPALQRSVLLRGLALCFIGKCTGRSANPSGFKAINTVAAAAFDHHDIVGNQFAEIIIGAGRFQTQIGSNGGNGCGDVVGEVNDDRFFHLLADDRLGVAEFHTSGRSIRRLQLEGQCNAFRVKTFRNGGGWISMSLSDTEFFSYAAAGWF